MTKAEEFEALATRAHYLHGRPDRGSGEPGEFVRAKQAFDSFCYHNSDLIAVALRQEDAIRAALAQQGHQNSGRILLRIEAILNENQGAA